LAKPVASFARCLLSPTPTEQISPVASPTAICTSRASASGSSVSAPTNASSQPHTSTSTGNPRSVAITCADADS